MYTLLIGGLAFMAPVAVQRKLSVFMQDGAKGFGGGEATRDPDPTVIDPNDPEGKQQAIHTAESFAYHLAKRGDSIPLVAGPYPNLPASVHPGVLTGQAVLDLLDDAKRRGCASPQDLMMWCTSGMSAA